jgi:hypothetical protein
MKIKYKNPFQVDREQDGLNGRVKRVYTEWVRFLDDIIHTKTDTNTFRQVELYDEIGNKIEDTVYNPDGTIASKEVFVYSNENLLIEKLSCKTGDSVEWKWVYQYDDEHQSLKEMMYDTYDELSSTEILFFDEYNRKTIEEVYDQDYILLHRNQYEYIEHEEYNETISKTVSAKGMLLKTRKYRYTPLGWLLEKFVYNANDMLESREKFQLDDFGNMIEETSLQSDGSIQYQYTFDYEYDSHNNWIAKNTKVSISLLGPQDRFLSEEYTRIVEYYD